MHWMYAINSSSVFSSVAMNDFSYICSHFDRETRECSSSRCTSLTVERIPVDSSYTSSPGTVIVSILWPPGWGVLRTRRDQREDLVRHGETGNRLGPTAVQSVLERRQGRRRDHRRVDDHESRRREPGHRDRAGGDLPRERDGLGGVVDRAVGAL